VIDIDIDKLNEIISHPILDNSGVMRVSPGVPTYLS